MARSERQIKFAFDNVSGEILEASQIFDTAKHAFEVRKQFHKKEVELSCCECEQKLNVSTSKYDNLHFKHEPNHEPCILSSGNMSAEDLEIFQAAAVAKESDRHKHLKNLIGNKLEKSDGVEKGSVGIDNKFIFWGKQKRRPDVYCIYNGNQIVFEIQLSNLSLKYILNRYEFYQKAGIYLIWILDKFSVYDQTQMARDIKYLTSYENFFKLDESQIDFHLACQYKIPFISTENSIHTKWGNKSVELSELTFDEKKLEVFYYNFSSEKVNKENELKIKLEVLRKQEVAQQRQVKFDKAKIKVDEIIKVIRQEKAGYGIFYRAKELIEELDPFEVTVLNDILNLKRRKGDDEKPAINHWISVAKQNEHGFLYFIFNCEAIWLNVNETDKNGKTCMQELLQNDALKHKFQAVKGLFKRNYQLTIEDKAILSNYYPDSTKHEPALIKLFERLEDRSLVDQLSIYSSAIFILESARLKSITGFNYKADQWASFGINAISHYGEYWQHIEKAFRYYGILSIILKADRKGTFSNHLKRIENDLPDQESKLDDIIVDLYPELLENEN
jgi:competence CoiA-like predicted nuclease